MYKAHIDFCVDKSEISVTMEKVKKELVYDLKNWVRMYLGEKWSVNMRYENNFISMYQQLEQSLHSSKEWALIKKYFPDSVVKNIFTY